MTVSIVGNGDGEVVWRMCVWGGGVSLFFS